MKTARVRMLILTFVTCVPIVAALYARAIGSQAQDVDPITLRVNEIFASTLREGVTKLSGGVVAITTVPPSNDAVAEIRAMGDKAIPAIAQHLKSPDPREEQLAVRFLGIMGGKEAVKLLGTTVMTSRNAASRLIALDWLSGVSWSDARQYVLHALNDPDPLVRKRAKEIASVQQ